jgi:DNA polymerase
LDRALAEVGIDRADAYVTNAVKHFKHRTDPATGRRIHVTPELADVVACGPWLAAELDVLDPAVLVVLGSTAGRALFGPQFRVGAERGLLRPWVSPVAARGEPGARALAFRVATVHPSAVLRADDQAGAYAGFVADLRLAAAVLG